MLKATAHDNIARVLRNIGMVSSLNWEACRVEEDRLFIWPLNGVLLEHVVLFKWNQDMRAIANAHHGTEISFREPGGVSPALQVCFHLAESLPNPPWAYFLEIDLDFHAPELSRPFSLIGHGVEVLRNMAAKQKTNPEEIARALDVRFGVEQASV